jgi:hypothetical protein
MDARFPYSPAEVAKVHLVQFGILSPDEIVIPLASPPRTSLCLVTNLGGLSLSGHGY